MFSRAILNAMYHFHGSASAYAAFWNGSFAQHTSTVITRRQVWQAFVQESIRTIASSSGFDLELQDHLNIEEITKEAFAVLGENGIIRSADQHECSECCHPHKATSDILTADDPAAVVGIDENRVVPTMGGDQAGLAAMDAAVARQEAAHHVPGQADEDVDMGISPVRMVVIDGIVMGHPVSQVLDDS
jgi:hypothetical protein